MMRALTITFALLFTTAGALSGTAGLLVTASLFIADTSPQSNAFLNIHLFVSGIFLGMAALVFAIELQVYGLASAVRALDDGTGRQVRSRLIRLLALLGIAGVFLCGLFALVTYGILARIDEGFAVFG